MVQQLQPHQFMQPPPQRSPAEIEAARAAAVANKLCVKCLIQGHLQNKCPYYEFKGQYKPMCQRCGGAHLGDCLAPAVRPQEEVDECWRRIAQDLPSLNRKARQQQNQQQQHQQQQPAPAPAGPPGLSVIKALGAAMGYGTAPPPPQPQRQPRQFAGPPPAPGQPLPPHHRTQFNN